MSEYKPMSTLKKKEKKITEKGFLPWILSGGLFVGCLLNVPATCKCISGTNLHRQFDVLPHWDRNCRSNFLPHPVTVYWHQADQSQSWPYNARRLAGEPLECQCLSHWYDSTPKKSRRKRDSNPGSSALEADAFPLGQRGGFEWRKWNSMMFITPTSLNRIPNSIQID